VLWAFHCSIAFASSEPANIQGELAIDPYNLSGIVVTDEFLALATDEGTAIQILPRHGSRFISQPNGKIPLLNSDTELDLEGLAWQKPYLYAIGSHSLKRKKIKPGQSNKKAMKRMAQTVRERSREWLFRIQLNDHLKPIEIEKLSLRPILEKNPIITPFLNIPSKENGVDIEGIAVNGKHLYVGFRGPILRQQQLPVLRLTLKRKHLEIKKAEWKWVNLNGLGIRDMVTVDGGITLLGGPMNRQPQRYALFHWNGETDFNPKPPFTVLPKTKGKPEGLAWDGKRYWLVEDGIKNGNLRTLQFK
jgi:hypothetical protein